MIVLLMGAPGAGKGTQAELLASKLGLRKLSTGDALRKHVKLGTEIGRLAGSIMDRGELVPDEVLFKILTEELSSAGQDIVTLLDGYPRNVAQAKALEAWRLNDVRAAIHLDVPRDILISRLSGRRVCGSCGATYHIEHNPPDMNGLCKKCGGNVSQRPDDRAEAVAVRLEVYEKNTRPVLDYYSENGKCRHVDGAGGAEIVFGRIKGIIDEICSSV